MQLDLTSSVAAASSCPPLSAEHKQAKIVLHHCVLIVFGLGSTASAHSPPGGSPTAPLAAVGGAQTAELPDAGGMLGRMSPSRTDERLPGKRRRGGKGVKLSQ